MKITSVKKLHVCNASFMIVYKDTDLNLIPEALHKEIKTLEKRKTFKIENFGIRKFYFKDKPFYVCSLGKDKADIKTDDLRLISKKIFVETANERYKSINIQLDEGEIEKSIAYKIIAEYAKLSEYKFDWFKSDRKDPVLEEVKIVDRDTESDFSEFIKEGILLANAVKTTRELVDEPANIMVPETLANKAKEAGKKHGFKVTVYDESKIKKLEMNAFLSVGRGATRNPSKLIVMKYNGDKKNKKTYGLVGKGICFDSGGYCLKPSTGMVTMKLDMGGAATVIGAMQAIADAKLKINVTAVIAACQNMIGPDSYMPGDIIKSMNGKTIYIGNTDAEGRLTLVDAVTYIIRKENVDTVFDFATLTGAACMAFGSACAATLSNNDEIYSIYETAAKNAGEKIWRMPMFDEYKETLKHKEADVTNMSGTPGMITAGMFVGEFVEDKPWIHVDIAPIAYMEKETYFYDYGATGYGVKTCYEFMKLEQNKE